MQRREHDRMGRMGSGFHEARGEDREEGEIEEGELLSPIANPTLPDFPM